MRLKCRPRLNANIFRAVLSSLVAALLLEVYPKSARTWTILFVLDRLKAIILV